MNKENFKIFLQIVGFVAVIGGALYLAYLSRNNELVRSIVASYGYIGVFLVAVFSGFNLVVPVPAVTFLPLMLEAGLSFWFIVVVISLGVTLADSVAFFLGRKAKELTGTTNNKVVGELKKVERTNELAPLVGLFLFVAFAPLPSEILLAPFGYLNYRFVKILPIVLVGNLTFNTIYSLGLVSLFKTIA